MGTRNLTIVVKNKEYKVAQYGQWDGYPTGQGATIAKFIQKMDLRKFKKAVDECHFLSSEEINKRWKEAGADGTGWVTFDISNKMKKKHPQLDRDIGAGVLSLIQKGTRELKNDLDFAGSSLFCEYAYVIDLDRKKVEVYKGFNKKPLSTRARFRKLKGEHGYHPVKLWKTYDFKDFTVEAMKKLEKSEEAEE